LYKPDPDCRANETGYNPQLTFLFPNHQISYAKRFPFVEEELNISQRFSRNIKI